MPSVSEFLAGGLGHPDVDVAERLQAGQEAIERHVSLTRPFADGLAGGAIDHDRDDIPERATVFMDQIRVAQAHEQKGEGERPKPCASGATQNERERCDESQHPERDKRPEWQKRRKGDRPDGHRVSLSMMSLAWT